MTTRVTVSPALLQWAQHRSGKARAELAKRFPKLPNWEAGTVSPTLKQLGDFAHATYTPIGFFFLTTPPQESLPIPDFRTLGDEEVSNPGPDLLDTIYLCEQRQEWYREYALDQRLDTVSLTGALELSSTPQEAAEQLAATLGYSLDARRRARTYSDAFRELIEAVEGAGVLVMVNGIVGNNTHRKLNPRDFRGFSLVDDYAPIVFVNGADSKSAQIFTLIHEVAHVLLGESGVDRPTPSLTEPQKAEGSSSRPDTAAARHARVESWCNAVAAEYLVPLRSLPARLTGPTLKADLDRLASVYKVSTLVILRRLRESGRLSWDDYRAAYESELEEIQAALEANDTGASGGSFYNTQPYRVSRRFARALVVDTLEGRTLHRDAFHLLGVRKYATFQEFGERLGVA